MERTIKHITRPEMKEILHVQSAVLKSLHDFMWNENLVQLMPVILAPFTDPLAHTVSESAIEYSGQKLQLTKSMILHKQLSMLRDDIHGIYVISPNVRLERGELSSSGRHLFEFSQVDIELKGASHTDFMRFMERLYLHMFSFVRSECRDSLKSLGREIELPSVPFPVYDSTELETEFGAEWEHLISMQETQPFWVTDHYREFYDKEDPITRKHINYDIIYPEGFGEGLSGAERETDYDVIIRKMKERKTDPTSYKSYLEIAKKGILRPTAGGGFGVERLVRYLTGKKQIQDVCMFPRVPGEDVVI
ncbi:asparagine synthetase A [Candidatus Micrarchaeota archaeon]|nr:asparagine synthetase A [Candidatus Micrarchaeota archaeon]MBU1165413.1 asparagine synthetase A [Candidatus Micrarchaeota archaeon]MBU1886277.1 asparagine synthetase A [Candidatus Micrarchaeota archaeon]